jgi:hypothetical protein
MQKITDRREALTRPCRAFRGAPNQHNRLYKGVTKRPHTAQVVNFRVSSPKLEATL